MKSAILATLIASAAAFAPAKQAATTTSLAAFEDELGVQAPLGFYDPLGFMADADQDRFDRLRLVEIKHGRIAMLGVVGYLVTYAGIRFPGAEDIPSGFAALDNVPASVWAQMAFTVGLMEAVNRDETGENEFVGDFRNGAIDFGWDTFSDDVKMQKRAIELNQGRAAQMGLLGLMVHEKLGNVDILLPPGGH
jgi:hypothetical protein